MPRQLSLVLGVMALVTSSMAADVSIFVVSPFGNSIPGCHITSLRTAAEEHESSPGYGDRFEGLAIRQVPLGEYEAIIRCGKVETYKTLSLIRAHQFEEIALSGRLLVSDDRKPKLLIKLKTAPVSGPTWWIRFVGLYNGESYTDRFSQSTGEATIVDPEPGSYTVTVSSTNGYSCMREVDFVEFTEAWTFSPTNCSFELDPFAHIVREEDKRDQKRSGWYSDMLAARGQFQRALSEELPKK